MGGPSSIDPAQFLFMSTAAFEARERVVSAALSAAAEAETAVATASLRANEARSAVDEERVAVQRVAGADVAVQVRRFEDACDAYDAAVAVVGEALKKQFERGRSHVTAHLTACCCHRASQGPHGAAIGAVPPERYVYTEVSRVEPFAVVSLSPVPRRSLSAMSASSLTGRLGERLQVC